MGFTTDLDMIFVTTSVFGFSWSAATFGASLMQSSSLYSAHVVMIMDVLLTFFSGAFFLMERLYLVFEVLHYVNPLFYTLSAVSYVIASGLNNGCGQLQIPGECASGRYILNMAQIAPFSSLAAQGYCILFALVIFFFTALQLRAKETIGQNDHEYDAEEGKDDPHSSRYSKMMSGSLKTLTTSLRIREELLSTEDVALLNASWDHIHQHSKKREGFSVP